MSALKSLRPVDTKLPSIANFGPSSRTAPFYLVGFARDWMRSCRFAEYYVWSCISGKTPELPFGMYTDDGSQFKDLAIS